MVRERASATPSLERATTLWPMLMPGPKLVYVLSLIHILTPWGQGSVTLGGSEKNVTVTFNGLNAAAAAGGVLSLIHI